MASIVKNVVHWSTHGQRLKQQAQVAPVVDLCEICGKKPKYIENGRKHPYCSRSCARNGSGNSPTACVLSGCRATGKPAFANFCSDAHARDGVRLGQVDPCQFCQVQPRIVGMMCIACDRLVQAGPRLRELNADHKTFKNLRAQFLSEWESSKGTPGFEKVFEVILPSDIRQRHEKYRSSHPTFQEVRSFHSSQCICDLGTKEASLCNFKSCGICTIVKSSFRQFAFGANFNSGRFGDGIYSYRNPALADRHATSCTTSPYRVMIACDVLVESGQTDLDEGSEEESLFVPVSDAILPAYIIMYTA
ncbi:hypothetical protein CVT24_009110 [Panaeolus cyanescens]|uniref:PARP catalytic domain-containing protein n=1 Tax=Panaeolus cyanescens TaxID=181874 RepID=A0A409VDI1_9AGAR|nr:hypothetical protein CVT24_009110 [Panaeolus cyanescens]